MNFILTLALILTAPQGSSSDASPADAMPFAPLDYRVGPGDQLSIRVYGATDFERTTRVSNSGRIHVPYIGVFSVAGMSPVEVEREIARLIRDQQLINEPAVRVRVEEYRAQPVYILGAVNTPGQFVITNRMHLLDLISKAGGLLPAADLNGLLYRRTSVRPSVDVKIVGEVDPEAPAVASTAVPDAIPEESLQQIIEIDFQALSEGSRPELNLPLQGGDIIYVPRAPQRNFFIIGDVNVPGAYTLPRRGEITATQAIIYAGGPNATASTGSAFIMRRDESGERQAEPFDFAAVIRGEQPDVVIQPDDIVFVPTSNVRTIGVGLLNLVPRLIQQFLIF